MFKLDSGFGRALTHIGNLAILSVLWLVCSAPLFTIGAANTAMYTAIHKVIGQGEGNVFQQFFRGFRESFRQATLSFLPLDLLGVITIVESFVTGYLQEQGAPLGALRPVFLLLGGVTVIWMVYVGAYTARFLDTVKKTLKVSGILLLMYPLASLLLLAVFILGCIAIRFFQPLIMVFPGLYGWLAHSLLERIFLQYIAQADKNK